MVQISKKMSQRQMSLKLNLAHRTTWLPNSFQMRECTRSSRTFGRWDAYCLKWQRVNRHLLPLLCKNWFRRFKKRLCHKLKIARSCLMIFWLVCWRRILLSAFRGSIWGSIHFGQKRLIWESCQGSLLLRITYAQQEEWTQINLSNNKRETATSSRI